MKRLTRLPGSLIDFPHWIKGLRRIHVVPAAHLILRAVLVSGVLLIAGSAIAAADKGYVAHEWGTFTSFQRSNGELLDWHPLNSSVLPGFVYDWSKPGFNRQCSSPFGFQKSQVICLQRMETPVIYFYAKDRQTVDVEVRFPQGLITEWYPQTSVMGPATIPAPWLVSRLDELAHKSGVKPDFSFGSWMRTPAASDSRARWAQVQILPNSSNPPPSPMDSSGSHYFSARETDANLLQVSVTQNTNHFSQYERFLFYRGVGNFQTPLHVTLGNDQQWVMSNTDSNQLTGLFLLRVEDGKAAYRFVKSLGSDQSQRLPAIADAELEPISSVTEKLGKDLESVLQGQGLYPREARAMVETWHDSWLTENGLRVLYLLPRPWTDRILPLKLDPTPTELTRVMVGRAEILPSETEYRLASEVDGLGTDNSHSDQALLEDLARLGRFAEPALRLVTEKATPEQNRKSWELLRVAAVETQR